MQRLSIVFVCVLLAAGGCKKKEEAASGGGGGGGGVPSCPEAQIKMGDEAFVPQNMLGVKDTTTGAYSIFLFGEPGVACEDVIKRQWSGGGTTGSVYTGGEGMFATGVALDNNINPGGNTRLDAKPEKAGDTMTICVPEPIEWEATVGSHDGQKFSFVGSFSASYCGEM